MKIIPKSKATHIDKYGGIKADYYLRKEYELHYGVVNGKMSKIDIPWHHHEKIFESLFIIEGELTVKWKEGDEIKKEVINSKRVPIGNPFLHEKQVVLMTTSRTQLLSSRNHPPVPPHVNDLYFLGPFG